MLNIEVKTVIITLYSVIGDFLLILRLFKDVAFTFVGRKTLKICYVPNFGNK